MDLQLVLLEEEEDDDLLLQYYLSLERASTNLIFQFRNEEGYFKILIQRHLNANYEMFRDYCRFNKQQFNFFYNIVKEDLHRKTKRDCIGAEEKLFLTLRYVYVY